MFREKRLWELPYDCIIIVKKEGAALTFNRLETYLQQAYKHIATEEPHAS